MHVTSYGSSQQDGAVLDNIQLMDVADRVQHIRERLPASTCVPRASLHISDRKRALGVRGELGHASQIGVVANEGEHLIVRVGIQMRHRELKLLVADKSITEQHPRDFATRICIHASAHHVQLEHDVERPASG